LLAEPLFQFSEVKRTASMTQISLTRGQKMWSKFNENIDKKSYYGTLQSQKTWGKFNKLSTLIELHIFWCYI